MSTKQKAVDSKQEVLSLTDSSVMGLEETRLMLSQALGEGDSGKELEASMRLAQIHSRTNWDSFGRIVRAYEAQNAISGLYYLYIENDEGSFRKMKISSPNDAKVEVQRSNLSRIIQKYVNQCMESDTCYLTASTSSHDSGGNKSWDSSEWFDMIQLSVQQ